MNNVMKNIAIGALAASAVGCGGGNDGGPLDNVDALVILQRPKRNDTGDIFQYTSYVPGARIVKLSPPSADGQLTTICCTQDPLFATADISSYDLSFDANQIVFSAKLDGSQAYGLFIVNLSDGVIQQIPTDPQRDYVNPVFLPGDYILFTTNAVVEAGAPQHQDEYERGTTIQMGRIRIDGSGEELGPRNLSHRTLPSLASDGRVIFTNWDHLGRENSGHLMFVNQDMQELREAFGKEGTGVSNSVLKAREISPGRFIAIATARDRTVQSGALVDIRLGTVVSNDGVVSAYDKMAEARASTVILTPDVPLDRGPSAQTIGRYYDAFPLDAKDKPDLLVSWADGPVESEVLAAAGLSANFGVYLYDSARQQRRPILDDPEMWDIFARPLVTRSAPPIVASATDPALGGTTEIGALNTYDSTIKTFDPGSIYGVRISEGFSSEEGFQEMFGTTEFEGQAVLGVVPLLADGSWRARVPGNIPIHLQAIDKFAMSLLSEPVWFSERAGGARMCGGCHEDRTKTVVVDPGVTMAFSFPPADAMSTVARNARLSTVYSRDQMVGAAWDQAMQPIFDAKCVECHGDSNTAGIQPYTVTDPTTGMSITWTFNLTGTRATNATVGDVDFGDWPKSYISMCGPDMEAITRGMLTIAGNPNLNYLNPEDARGSTFIKMMNPVQQYPTQNTSVRAFGVGSHLIEQGRADLTPDEQYRIIVATDLGCNFYSRENK